jgi:hypothetical protein
MLVAQNNPRGFLGSYQQNSLLVKRYPKVQKPLLSKKKKKKKVKKNPITKTQILTATKKANKNQPNINKHNLVNLKG